MSAKNNEDLVQLAVWGTLITLILVFVGMLFLDSMDFTGQTPEREQRMSAARIVPIGQVNVGAAPVVAAPVANAAPKSGEEVFNSVCTACHTSGLLNAPIIGNKEAWAPRVAKGMDGLMHSVLNGLNTMPARGGNPALSDDELKATVEYMLSKLEG